ncbi:class I SAM-dependent methyltransferase [Comamonas sp. JC664]|uniref:class I SAM-dependent methyltransferase n=1 Tax=Comamonas sp. JC664 TaxID=2801917 RepID=UPI00174DF0DD|nr:class I SAM-dependent methyltransferase [Comamonas sp. JC664]MBL0694553.1 class I SAM-dependent methyltransferase [Comamonas sp. JC664]GHG95921.1 SAM-dependent methyltransferase [Comamonas sp. KCTC 72670]
MSFFGELYLRSTLPFLSEAVTAREVDFLARAFADVPGPEPVVDLGCGHGRHAARLNASGPLAGRVIGLELDALSLSMRRPGFPAVQGDLRALPFREASLAGAYAWYSTLAAFTDAEHVHILREVARMLRPGGRWVFQTVPYERMEASPQAAFRQTLPDGSVLEESSHFDPRTGRDTGLRTLTTPDGRCLRASYALRYYPLAEWVGLLESTGFSVMWVKGGLEGEPLGPQSTDLIVGAERRHG